MIGTDLKTQRLKVKYEQEILPALKSELGYANSMAVGRLEKIVLNIGCGEASHDAKVLEEAQRLMAKISGQHPVVTRAKQAISNFKLRKNDPVGVKVTLRRKRMYEFFERLISVALPRIRDFRGLSTKSFDGAGNYSFGIKELVIFPEVPIDKIHYPLGMDVTLVTSAGNPKEALALLKGFGFPFAKR